MSKVFAIRLPLSDSREGNWHPSAEPLGCIVWELRSQHQIAALIQVYDTTHDTAVTTHAQNKQRLDDGADILSWRTNRHAAFAINTWSKVRRSNGWSGEKTCLFFSDWDQISFHFSAPPPAPPTQPVFFCLHFPPLSSLFTEGEVSSASFGTKKVAEALVLFRNTPLSLSFSPLSNPVRPCPLDRYPLLSRFHTGYSSFSAHTSVHLSWQNLLPPLTFSLSEQRF